MNKEDRKTLGAKTSPQLFSEVSKSRQKIAEMKKEMAFGKLKSHHKISVEKKKIAYIMTIIRQKAEAELEKNEKNES